MPLHTSAAITRLSVKTHSETETDAFVGQFIPLHYHGQMLAHQQRMSAFKEAIDRLVPEGARVLEFGGGTGVLSFFAAQKAAHVTCIEYIPHVARACRRLLDRNGVGDKVDVVECDAMDFVPSGPVDVVLCEMLHVGLLRERQVAVINRFKQRYLAKIGGPLPLFIPEASLLATQLVYEPYDFHGYHAPIPMFYEPLHAGQPTIELGPPVLYATVDYSAAIPSEFTIDATMPVAKPGRLNALRFITKNLVGIFKTRASEWHMQYLVIPVPTPIDVQAGDSLQVRARYQAGDSLLVLSESLQVNRS